MLSEIMEFLLFVFDKRTKLWQMGEIQFKISEYVSRALGNT